MKKTIATLAVASVLSVSSAFAQISWEEVSATATLDFETEYVFRGVKRAGDSLQSSLDVSVPAFTGDLYAGLWANHSLSEGTDPNEVDYYIGHTFPIDDLFSLDLGYTYYSHSNGNFAYNNSNEVAIGVAADVELSPAAYFYYDFDLEQTVFEFSIGQSYNLDEDLGWNNTYLDLGAYLGFLSADDRNTNGGGSNGYTYFGITADLVYVINDVASISWGVRYSHNNDDITAGRGSHDDNFWWGATASFGF